MKFDLTMEKSKGVDCLLPSTDWLYMKLFMLLEEPSASLNLIND